MAPSIDDDARRRIVYEQGRNVFVVAGAGTGKTKTIIDRAVELLAPTTGAAAVPIQRMAVITFTRRAAGELRYRIREHLLRALESAARTQDTRVVQLRDALGSLDAAFIGTIHGFADRLLRLRPIEAELSPAYALVEDTADLIRETLLRLRRATDVEALRTTLGDRGVGIEEELLTQAVETLRAASRAGIPMDRSESGFGPAVSLEVLLARMIETRDVPIAAPPIPEARLDVACAAVERLDEMLAKLRGATPAHEQLRRAGIGLRRLHGVVDPADAVRIVQEVQRRREPYKRDFDGDSWAWTIAKEIRSSETTPGSIADRLKGPHRWLAVRLVRLMPVVLAMYDKVKAEHEVVDYLDLLIKLRDLLRNNLDARRFYQGLFDHIFVDEFQDTDPLQCEVVFYLCEQGCAAGDWNDVQLAAGKLTIVGDPKQSIYRFRRADIAMYGQAAERLRACGALEERLEVNFRSLPPLIDFFNQQLSRVIGRHDNDVLDAHRGIAFYEDLAAAAPPPESTKVVHILPYEGTNRDGVLAAEGRGIEAAMLARYVRWLLQTQHPVRDPETGKSRPVRPGDIAVLACVTTNLPLLLRQFDAWGIEFNARGGTLFVGHPVIRQYLLALRALADHDDGVAEAALLRPPIFGLDYEDLVVAQLNKDETDPRRARVSAARAIIKDLRQRRHQRSPGATARDLIERTALGRTVVTGANGAQTLNMLYEVASEIDRRAGLDGLDYDAVTEILRRWAQVPVFLDSPAPIGSDAVQVMTMHGAKGLEFPVVILWDGFQTFSDRGTTVWQVDRTRGEWAMSLGALTIEHPPDAGLLQRERGFGENERRRMYYVAATRARDLLVVPRPATRGQLEYCGKRLIEDADAELCEVFETYQPGRFPAWAKDLVPQGTPHLVGDAALDIQQTAAEERFAGMFKTSATPFAAPRGVTTAALSVEDDAVERREKVQKAVRGRFGASFGIAVHRSLQLAISFGVDVDTAVTRCTRLVERDTGEHLAAAQVTADVRRVIDALQQAGLLGDGVIAATEYPIAGGSDHGQLLSGYIDFVAQTPEGITVVDFKTDAPRAGEVGVAFPRYAAQLRTYVDLLRAAGIGESFRAGLLFTATGEIRWMSAWPTAGLSLRRDFETVSGARADHPTPPIWGIQR